MDSLVTQARSLPDGVSRPELPFRHIDHLVSALEMEDAQRPALVFYKQGRCALRLSYGELVARIRSTQAIWTQRYAVVPGQRIAILSHNSPSFVTAALSLLALGAIVVPLNPADSLSNLQYILDQSGASLLLHSEDLAETAASAARALATVGLDEVFGDAALPQPAFVRTTTSDESAPAVLLFTSGTTGKPKGVLLSHDALLLNALGLQRNFNLARESAHLCVLPLYHANAWGFSLIATYFSRARLILCDRFHLLSFWEVADKEQATIASLTPALLKPLTQVGRAASSKPLQVVSAAAPLAVDVARRFKERTGLKVYQGYGLSECTNFAAILSPQLSDPDYDFLMHGHAQTCIGSALPGTDMEVVDERGDAVGPGVKGEIVVRGAHLMLGYWQAQAETSEALRGGKLHTGDEGWYLLRDGGKYFFVSGRYKDLIIRLGENISPTNVESQLGAIHAVGDFAVVGFRNVHVDEEVGLCLDPGSRHDLGTPQVAETITSALSSLPFFQRPKVVLVGPLQEARTSVGKLKRRLLAERFAEFTNTPFRPSDRPVVRWLGGAAPSPN